MSVPFVASWLTTKKGGPHVDVSPVNGGRQLVVLSPPDALREKAAAAGEVMRRGGFASPGAHMCSRATQQCLKAAGFPGIAGSGAGNANQLPSSKQLQAAGFRRGDPSNIRPGDLIVYMDGGGGYGHVGIAVSGGGVKAKQQVNAAQQQRAPSFLGRLPDVGAPMVRPSQQAQETLMDTLGLGLPDFEDLIADVGRQGALNPYPDPAPPASPSPEFARQVAAMFPQYADIVEWLYG